MRGFEEEVVPHQSNAYGGCSAAGGVDDEEYRDKEPGDDVAVHNGGRKAGQ
jgi:hypothetical protein